MTPGDDVVRSTKIGVELTNVEANVVMVRYRGGLDKATVPA